MARIATLMMLLTSFSCATPSADAPDLADLERDVRARNAALVDAERRRHAADAASYFAVDAVLIVPNVAPIVGREAIHETFERGYEFVPEGDFFSEVEELEIAPGGQVAIERGYNIDTTPKGVFKTNYLLIWRLGDGVWEVVALSVVPAP